MCAFKCSLKISGLDFINGTAPFKWSDLAGKISNRNIPSSERISYYEMKHFGVGATIESLEANDKTMRKLTNYRNWLAEELVNKPDDADFSVRIDVIDDIIYIKNHEAKEAEGWNYEIPDPIKWNCVDEVNVFLG
jgi:hypothetical protein